MNILSARIRLFIFSLHMAIKKNPVAKNLFNKSLLYSFLFIGMIWIVLGSIGSSFNWWIVLFTVIDGIVAIKSWIQLLLVIKRKPDKPVVV